MILQLQFPSLLSEVYYHSVQVHKGNITNRKQISISGIAGGDLRNSNFMLVFKSFVWPRRFMVQKIDSSRILGILFHNKLCRELNEIVRKKILFTTYAFNVYVTLIGKN